MTPETFRRRMDILRRAGYPVLTLADAVDGLERGNLPPAAVAITIDDGWYGTLTDAAPVLAEHGFPATLYLTTYYSETGSPVFDVLVSYLFWASHKEQVKLDGLADGLSGEYDLRDATARATAADTVVDFGNEHCNAAGRDIIARRLADRLGVDYGALERTRAFTLVSAEEARQMLDHGIDLQLHTHRHRFPADDRNKAEREIVDNRRAIAKISNSPLVHFCYPSGEYAPSQWPWLKELGIVSATTTAAGINFPGACHHALARQLDGEDVSDLEFEAELSGFTPLFRRWLGRSA